MRKVKNIINLYKDKNIFSIKQVISIGCEDDLNLFWSFITSSENTAHNLMHTFVTQFYNFVLGCIDKKKIDFFEIILEENSKYFYFTLWNKTMALHFKEHIQDTSLSYLYEKNKVTVRLNKQKHEENIQKILKKNKERTNKLLSSVSETKQPMVLEPYTFIKDDDLEELLQLNDDMQEIVFLIKKHSLSEDIFIPLRSTISLFCLTLRYYSEISPIATTITDFSNLLNIYPNEFLNLDEDQQALVCGFVSNIDTWLQNTFIKGGANLYFMDNSMQADLDMISGVIKPADDLKTDDLEDIFDF